MGSDMQLTDRETIILKAQEYTASVREKSMNLAKVHIKTPQDWQSFLEKEDHSKCYKCSMKQVPLAFDPVATFGNDIPQGFEAKVEHCGKQHLIPTSATLSDMKRGIGSMYRNGLTRSMRALAGDDFNDRFHEGLAANFDLAGYHLLDSNGLSKADIYTFLPIVIEDLKKGCGDDPAKQRFFDTIKHIRVVSGLYFNPEGWFLTLIDRLISVLEKVGVDGLRVLTNTLMDNVMRVWAMLLKTLAVVVSVFETAVGAGAHIAGGIGMIVGGAIMLYTGIGAPEGIALICVGTAVCGSGVGAALNLAFGQDPHAFSATLNDRADATLTLVHQQRYQV